MVDLLLGEGRGRLIHDEDLRVERERLSYLYDLLHPDADLAHQPPGVDLYAHRVEDFFGLLMHGGPLDEPEAVGDLAVAEDVVSDGEVSNQAQLLVNDADPPAMASAAE